MENILKSICEFERYSSIGKRKLINYVKEWAGEYLKNFRVDTQINFLSINVWEVSRVAALLLNLIFVLYISSTNSILNYFGTFVSVVIFYVAAFKMIFLFLTLITPSQNIILTKTNDSNDSKNSIIICAHYDTKNAVTSAKKGFIKSLFKENIYSLSRILTSYVTKFEKYMYLLIFAFYVLYTATRNSTVEAFSIIKDGPNIMNFGLQLIVEMFLYSLICAFIVYIVSFPYIKKMKNKGADDNGSGVCAALELARQLDSIELDAALKIILFDNEERGLIGSNHFISKFSKELRDNKAKIINVDCIGRGKSIYITTNKTKNNEILNCLSNNMKDMEITFDLCDMDYSDHRPFETLGLDAVTIGRYNIRRYLWYKNFPVIDWIHGSEDEYEAVDIPKINEVVSIVKNTIVKNYAINK